MTGAQSELLSTSNITYRYLHQPTILGVEIPVVDSVIVRYGHGQLGECVGTTELGRCVEAQARLMQAMGVAVGGADNLSLNYFETNTWANEYDVDWMMEMLANTEDYTDGLVGGGYSLAHWEMAENASDPFGEFAPRLSIDTNYDANDYTDIDETEHYFDYDDFSLLFFHPNDRDFDAIPGWYQRYSADFDFAEVPSQERPEAISFEVGRWGCSECGPDTVIEVSYIHYDEENDIDGLSGTVQFVLEAETYTHLVDHDNNSATPEIEQEDTIPFMHLAYDGQDDEDQNIIFWHRSPGLTNTPSV